MNRSFAWFLCAAVIAAGACASRSRGPYTASADAPRNPLEAQRLTQEAMKVVERNPQRAEELLRRALDADIFHGPAHNNLGVLFLERGELYLAAQEFEWSRKLMPGLVDPRMNLALTLERAGRIDDAMDEYRSALEVYPNHIPTVQAMARCRLRNRPTDPAEDAELSANLREIAMRGESPEWRDWARRQLALADTE